MEALLLGLLLAACGARPMPTPVPGAQPGHAEVVEGRLRLTLDLARTSWTAGEVIAGTASLTLLGVGRADLGGSGTGLFGFDFLEVGGHRHMVPAWTLDCRGYRLEPGQPMVSQITKSGGFTLEDPDAAFYQAFFRDPQLHLPAGEWRVTAVATFLEGGDCSGASHNLQAPLTILVLP